MVYNDDHSMCQPPGNCTRILLKPGEFITAVSGVHNNRFEMLRFETNRQTVTTINGDYPLPVYPDLMQTPFSVSGDRLLHIGHCKTFGSLTGLRFYFNKC